jgi:hypothetical protein
VYGVPLLDSMLHTNFITLQFFDPLCVNYAGGVEAAYFIRRPTTKTFYSLRIECPGSIEGRKSRHGDVLVRREWHVV